MLKILKMLHYIFILFKMCNPVPSSHFDSLRGKSKLMKTVRVGRCNNRSTNFVYLSYGVWMVYVVTCQSVYQIPFLVLTIEIRQVHLLFNSYLRQPRQVQPRGYFFQSAAVFPESVTSAKETIQIDGREFVTRSNTRLFVILCRLLCTLIH